MNGKLGYRVYVGAVGGVSFTGDKLPEWEDVPKKIQDAWNAATDAVYKRGYDDALREKAIAAVPTRRG